MNALRESGRHSGWHNREQNKRSAIPRHTEVKDILANKIYKNLAVKSVNQQYLIIVYRRGIKQ